MSNAKFIRNTSVVLVEKDILENKKLSLGAKGLYCYLLLDNNNPKIDIEIVAKSCGTTKVFIDSYLAELYDQKLINKFEV